MKALLLADAPPDIPLKDLVREVDIIIDLGDMLEPWIADLKDLAIPKIGVHGNHDFDRTYNPTQTDFFPRLGITNLHLNPTEIGGLTYVGFDGAMGYVYAENDQPYQEIDLARYRSELEKLKDIEKCDVFVTHGPSLRTLDLPRILGHKGIGAFRKFIERTEPKYHLHGHMHRPGEAMIGTTQVYSVFPYLKLDL